MLKISAALAFACTILLISDTSQARPKLRLLSSTPKPAAVLGGRNLVADPLGRDLPLELGKRQQHVQGQTPRRGGGVELLGDRDKGYAMQAAGIDCANITQN